MFKDFKLWVVLSEIRLHDALQITCICDFAFEMLIKYICTACQKKSKHPYLFQYKLSYRNETGINHHRLLSTSV